MLHESASQTVGPYVHIGVAPTTAGLAARASESGNVLAGPGAQGERIVLEGVVHDGEGVPLRDALVEIWQANAFGRHDHPDDDQDKPRSAPAVFAGAAEMGADHQERDRQKG